ncbi:MAG: hypothetical protein J5965_20380 [Aeriscardovia sp.]|nr:hypothetical protein [Aeriscardovia sp.]
MVPLEPYVNGFEKDLDAFSQVVLMGGMLLANKTVPLSKKIALYASAHAPMVFTFLSRVFNLVRR